MSTPYGPPGSEEPPQWGQQPSGQGYPPPGYPQGYPPQGYPPPGYPQGYPPQGYPPPGYPQGYPPPTTQPGPGYGQGFGPPPGYDRHPPGYDLHPSGYDQYGQPPYPPQGYQPYGPQPGSPPSPGDPAQPDHGGAPQKSALPWIIVGVGGVTLAVILLLGFVTPGLFTTTIFDQNAVQQGVQRILSDEYGQNAQSVRCPAEQEVRPGATFTCQAMIDGEQRDVTITVKTDAGEYEVARPS
jgi:hypothetical protein